MKKKQLVTVKKCVICERHFLSSCFTIIQGVPVCYDCVEKYKGRFRELSILVIERIHWTQ